MSDKPVKESLAGLADVATWTRGAVSQSRTTCASKLNLIILVELGLLEASTLPVGGVQSVRNALNHSHPPTALIRRTDSSIELPASDEEVIGRRPNPGC